MSANMQHASKLGGTATSLGDRTRMKNILENLKKLHEDGV